MDNDQLLEKSLQAIINIKAASEYCLFNAFDSELLCMTKAEWSSWIQAIGAILAIVGSAVIASRQFIKGEIVKEESAARQLMQFYAHINMYYSQISSVGESIVEDKFDIDSIVNFYNLINEILLLLRNIKIEDLSAEWASVCIMARSTTVQLSFSLKRMIEGHHNLMTQYHDVAYKREVNDPEIQIFFERFRRRMISGFVVVMKFAESFNDQVLILNKTLDKKSRFFKPADLNKHFNVQPIDVSVDVK